MTEIQRLLDGNQATGLEQWLLASAARERPPALLVAKMRTGLGLSTLSLVTHATTLSSAKLTLLAIAMSALMGVRTTNSAACGPAVTATTAAELFAQDDAWRQQSASRLAELTTDEPASVDPAEITAVAKTAAIKRSTERSQATGTNRSAKGTDLREEIRLLDLARNAIRNHQPEEALFALSAYSNRFSSGTFKQEASVLRMQALEQRGELGHASTIARQFVEKNPNSPYAQRAARLANSSAQSSTPH